MTMTANTGTTKRKKYPTRQPGEQRAEDLEAGSELFVAIAYHYAQWDAAFDETGENPKPDSVEVLDEDDTSEVIVGVYTNERLYRIGVECYYDEHCLVEGGLGPISAIAVHQTTLNQHGTGPWVNGFDKDGWVNK